MKKLVLKTAVITLSVTLILAVSAFGIVSFVAPSAMMRFFDSIGLESISGDYAYQQYQISGDLEYLAHSFEIAVSIEKDSVALSRFDEFYGEEGSDRREQFSEYCDRQNLEGERVPEEVRAFDYRCVVCGQVAILKYRAASTEEEKESVCDFAVAETGEEITADSPLVALASDREVLGDRDFCTMLLIAIRSEGKFNSENELYGNIEKILEEASE